MNKKNITVLIALLCMQTITPKTNPQQQEECDWYCKLMKEASAPIPAPAPLQPPTLTPQQLGRQLAQLSNSNRSLALQEAATQLATPRPTGNAKTSSFLTGLYTALDNLKTLLSRIKNSKDLKDLNPISTQPPCLLSDLLQMAASL